MAQTHRLGRKGTSIKTENGFATVRLYSTDIVRYNEKVVFLNSGGWRTNTTRTRMNQASNQLGLGYNVFQKDFSWFVHLPNGKTVDFSDNMKITRRK